MPAVGAYGVVVSFCVESVDVKLAVCHNIDVRNIIGKLSLHLDESSVLFHGGFVSRLTGAGDLPDEYRHLRAVLTAVGGKVGAHIRNQHLEKLDIQVFRTPVGFALHPVQTLDGGLIAHCLEGCPLAVEFLKEFCVQPAGKFAVLAVVVLEIGGRAPVSVGGVQAADVVLQAGSAYGVFDDDRLSAAFVVVILGKRFRHSDLRPHFAGAFAETGAGKPEGDVVFPVGARIAGVEDVVEAVQVIGVKRNGA